MPRKSRRPASAPRTARRRLHADRSCGNCRMAEGQLPAGAAHARARRGGHLLGRTPLGVPVRAAKAVVRALPRARPHGSHLAGGIWRRGLFTRGRGDSGGGNAAAPRPPSPGELRHFDARPRSPQIRHGRAEADPFAAHRARRNPLVPGLFGTRRGFGPRLAAHQGRGPGRSFPRQRAEDLDLLRRQGRLDILPRANRSRRDQAKGHLLPLDRHGDARAFRPSRSC